MFIGHIIKGLAMHFVPRKLTLFKPLEHKIFDEDFLVRAEIITDLGRLEDADYRRCYQLHQTALRHEEVPLPKVVENFDDISEEDEEDVKLQVAHGNVRVNKKDGKAIIRKKNRAVKRKRFEENIEKVEKKIEDVAN